MVRHWNRIQWLLWIQTLTAVGTGAGYVPDGAIYVIESASERAIESYNILEMEVTFHSPDLRFQWYIHYNAFNFQPVTDEISKEMGIFIEEHYSPEGQTTTRLWQKIQHYARDSRRNTALAIQSEDGRLMFFHRNVIIEESASPVPPYSTDSPAQRYVTKRPPPLARWSADKAAEITTEVWSMQTDEDEFYIVFIKSEERTDPFTEENCIYNNLNSANPDCRNIDGVNVTVQKKIIYGLMRYSITVHTQRSGLVLIAFEAMYGQYRLGAMLMSAESVSKMEDGWLDNKGYNVLFRRADHEVLHTGREFVLQCEVSGGNLKPQMVEMSLNGTKLSDVSYVRFVPGYLYVLYETRGSEEGEFECKYEDEATGVVKSASKSVTRV